MCHIDILLRAKLGVKQDKGVDLPVDSDKRAVDHNTSNRTNIYRNQTNIHLVAKWFTLGEDWIMCISCTNVL